MKLQAATLLSCCSMIWVAADGQLWAQATATPQTYSFTEDPAFALAPGPTVLKVSRDGDHEAVDETIAGFPGHPKPQQYRIVYDFQAHKIYTKILSDSSVPCSVMEYTSPAAPPQFDVVSGSADFLQQLASESQSPPKQVGTENVDGVAASIMEVGRQAPPGRARIWVAQKGNFLLKWVIIAANGQQQTMIEVKQLSFAKPPAADLAPPTGCAAVEGKVSASGGHAEVSFGASAAQEDLAAAVGGNAGDYIDAIHPPPDTASQAGCRVSFKVVRSGSMAQITSGFDVKLDISSDCSAANQRDVTAQLRGGVLGIDNAPKQFYLDVRFADSASAALIYTRCLKSQMELLLVKRNASDAHVNKPDLWVWVNQSKP
jgi:hypothetical protein